MRKYIIILICLIAITSCKDAIKSTIKKSMKKEFRVTKIESNGKFKIVNGRLSYNEFEIEILNNSGIDITNAFLPRSETNSYSEYCRIEVQVGEAEADLTWYHNVGISKTEISENKPWKNGEKRSFKIEEPYNPFFDMYISEYAIRDYEIKKVNLVISLIATNNVLKYEFIEDIKEVDLKNELKEFAKTIK